MQRSIYIQLISFPVSRMCSNREFLFLETAPEQRNEKKNRQFELAIGF